MAIVLVATCTIPGCKSSTAVISESANEVIEISESSEQRFVTHGDDAGVAEQKKIQSIAGNVQVELQSVTDAVPSWLQNVREVAFVIGGIVVIVLLWQSGLGMLLRGVVGWFPRRTQRQADMIESVMKSEKPENIRELIAQMRAADTLLDEALRRKK